MRGRTVRDRHHLVGPPLHLVGRDSRVAVRAMARDSPGRRAGAHSSRGYFRRLGTVARLFAPHDFYVLHGGNCAVHGAYVGVVAQTRGAARAAGSGSPCGSILASRTHGRDGLYCCGDGAGRPVHTYLDRPAHPVRLLAVTHVATELGVSYIFARMSTTNTRVEPAGM